MKKSVNNLNCISNIVILNNVILHEIYRVSEGKILKKIKRLIAAVSICTMAFSAVGCKMVEKTPEAIQNTVYATVGNSKITKGDLEEEFDMVLKLYYSISLNQLKEQYGEDYANDENIKSTIEQIRQMAFTQLVTRLLSEEQTEIQISEDELNAKVDEELAATKESFAENGEDAFTTALEQLELTEDSYKDILKKELYVQMVQDEIVKDIEVTDEDIQTYYDENKDTEFTTAAGADCSHILIAETKETTADDGTTSTEIDYEASLAKANEVKAKLDAGADFAELAAEYGTDGTKDSGGELGYITYDSTDYDTDFLNGFKELGEGEISAPVKTQFGYHLIKASGLKDATVTSLEDATEQIKATLLQQKQSEAYKAKIAEWKEQIKINVKEDEFKDYDKTTDTTSSTES